MRHNWIDEMGILEHDVSLGVKKVFLLDFHFVHAKPSSRDNMHMKLETT
jgi:hypothetical protein